MEADVEYVPVSARVSFKLQAWKENEESTEFTTITTETNTIVKAFQLNLKEQIIKNIKLERDIFRVKIRQELCGSLFSVVELYLEALGSEPQYTHEILLAILQANGPALLRHVPGTFQDFTILYRTVHNVPIETHATRSGDRLSASLQELGRPTSSSKSKMNFKFLSLIKQRKHFRHKQLKKP
jgi:hypothetical protein